MINDFLNGLAVLLATVILVPYRIYARLTERMIERQRTAGWSSGFADQQSLNMATDMAMRQAAVFARTPAAGRGAVEVVNALGI